MRKNGIPVVRLHGQTAETPSVSLKVDESMAVFLRDESLRYLEQAARRPRLKQAALQARLKRAMEEREDAKRNLRECVEPRVSGGIVIAVSEQTRKRMLKAAFDRFDKVNRFRDRLLELLKRVEVELRVLDEERRRIMSAYYTQIARHCDAKPRSRRHRRSNHP